jgi:hypothetical protein
VARLELARLRARADQMMAGLRYGQPPQQPPSVSRDEARRRSNTPHLWAVFREPGASRETPAEVTS